MELRAAGASIDRLAAAAAEAASSLPSFSRSAASSSHLTSPPYRMQLHRMQGSSRRAINRTAAASASVMCMLLLLIGWLQSAQAAAWPLEAAADLPQSTAAGECRQQLLHPLIAQHVSCRN